MLTFPCPNCAKLLKAADTSLGKPMRCPVCKHVFKAPERPFSPDPIPVPAPATSPPPPPEPEPNEEPVSFPLADEPQTGIADPNAIPFQDGDYAEEPSQEGEPGRKKKKKRKKKKRKESESLLDLFRYYTDAFGAFPWIMLGLVGLLVACSGVSFLFPPMSLLMIVLGSLVYLGGWMWFIVVAFRDDSFHGILCLVTHLYWMIYLFMNLEETWRPTAMMIAGIVFAAAGLGLLVAFTVPE